MRSRRGEDGAVMVLTVASMVMVLGATALSVDIGRLVSRNRDLQGVADAVALDAVTLLDGQSAGSVAGAVDTEALAAAQRNDFTPETLVDNLGHSTPEGGPAGSVLAVTFGVWTPPWGATTGSTTTTTAGTPTGTFAPVTDASAVPNAIKVMAQAKLGYVFVGGSQNLSRSGTADDVAMAGATLGSWAASFNSTQVSFPDTQVKVLNGLLSTLEGVYDTSSSLAPVDLTAVSYQGLADASVELGDIASADPSIGTVSNLVSGTYSPGLLTTDLATALDNRAQKEISKGDLTAGTNLEQASVTVSGLAKLITVNTGIDVCKMLSVAATPPPKSGPSFTCNPTDPSAASATVNVLRFVKSVAELALANGQNGFYVDLGIGSKVLLSASAIQAAQEMGPCAPGPWCTVQTDQVAGTLQTPIDASTSLSVAASAADAQATLQSVTCAGGNQYPDSTSYSVSTTGATLGATVQSALGTYQATDVIPGGSGTLSWSQAAPDPPAGPSDFTPADAQSYANPTPSVSFPTFTPALPATISDAVNTVLSKLDPQIPDVLTALGVAVEGATLTSWPVVCNAPQLVQ